MEHFLLTWGYLALFAVNLISSMGLPIGSEVVIGYGGALASGQLTVVGHDHRAWHWSSWSRPSERLPAPLLAMASVDLAAGLSSIDSANTFCSPIVISIGQSAGSTVAASHSSCLVV